MGERASFAKGDGLIDQVRVHPEFKELFSCCVNNRNPVIRRDFMSNFDILVNFWISLFFSTSQPDNYRLW